MSENKPIIVELSERFQDVARDVNSLADILQRLRESRDLKSAAKTHIEHCVANFLMAVQIASQLDDRSIAGDRAQGYVEKLQAAGHDVEPQDDPLPAFRSIAGILCPQ